LLNRAGMTFRKLRTRTRRSQREEGHRADAGAAVDDQAAGARSRCGKLVVGFKPELYSEKVAAG